MSKAKISSSIFKKPKIYVDQYTSGYSQKLLHHQAKMLGSELNNPKQSISNFLTNFNAVPSAPKNPKANN